MEDLGGPPECRKRIHLASSLHLLPRGNDYHGPNSKGAMQRSLKYREAICQRGGLSLRQERIPFTDPVLLVRDATQGGGIMRGIDI